MEYLYQIIKENPTETLIYVFGFIVAVVILSAILIKLGKHLDIYRDSFSALEFTETMYDLDYEVNPAESDIELTPEAKFLKAKRKNTSITINFAEFTDKNTARNYYLKICGDEEPGCTIEFNGKVIQETNYWYKNDKYNTCLRIGNSVMYSTVDLDDEESTDKVYKIFSKKPATNKSKNLSV